MKLDYSKIVTSLVTYVLLGMIALGGKLVIDNGIDKVDELDDRLDAVEAVLPEIDEGEPEEKGWVKKTWNWVTLKEFRK